MTSVYRDATRSRRPGPAKRMSGLLAVSLLALTAACASPEQKVERYSRSASELMEKGDLAKAYIQYQNVLKINEEHVPSLMGLAEIAEQRQDFQSMFNYLQAVVRLDPSQSVALVKLGKLYLIGNDETAALETAEKALALDASNLDAKGLKAGILLKLGDKAGAEALAKEIVSEDAANAEAVTVLATLYSLDGDYNKAIDQIDAALAINSKEAILQLLRIHLLKLADREDESLAAYEGLIESFPDQAAYRRVYANELVVKERFAEAREQLEEVARLEPGNIDARFNVVRVINAHEGPAAAEARLKAFIDADPREPRLRFALADFYTDAGDAEKARAVLDGLAKDDDADVVLDARNRIASFLYKEGKKAEAQAMIDSILATDERNTSALVKRAAIQIEEGSFDQAIVNLRTAQNNDPDHKDAMLLMSVAFEKQGNISFAQAELAKAFENSKYDPKVSNHFARFLLRQKNVERAERVLAESLDIHPADLENLRLLASIRLAQQDWRGAEEIGARLEKLEAGEALATEVKSAAYIGLEDYDSIISTLSEKAGEGELSPRPLTALVAAYVREDRADEAETLLKRVLESEPGNYTAKMLLARVYSHTKNVEGFQSTLFEATQSHPDRAEAFELLYRSYLAQGRAADAEGLIENGLAAAPGNDALRVYKADLLLMKGDREAALALYSELIKVRPDDKIIANNFVSLSSDLRLDEQSVARALEIAKRIETLENPYYQDTAGWAYYRAGQYERALELLTSAVEGAADNPELLYHLGAAQAATGDSSAARATLEKALANTDASAPYSPDIKALLDRLN